MTEDERGAVPIRTYRPGDEHELLALHNREFTPARSAAHWRWKYLDNPLRRTEIVLALAPDGRCAGSYCGLTHRAVLDGEPCLAGLHLDVAIDRERRRGLAGARLLARLVRRHLHLFAGGETRLTWGYPEPALHRVGLRFGRFQVLRDVVFLVRPAERPFAGGAAGLDVAPVARFGPDVDELWRRCLGAIRTGVVRDRRYLDWRYADHPDVPHALLEAREPRGGALRGVAVLREGGWDERLASLLDWLVPPQDAAAEAALLAAWRQWAAERARPWLACWVAGAPERFRRWQAEHGFLAQVTPYQECFRSWAPGATRRRLNEQWHTTMGDIDFF